MDGYVQTGIGISVSILLFWISYRQIIGAKKERTRNANKSVHRAIIRRMVLENYAPEYMDITRVIEGKAREFNTSVGDMLSEEQVLNVIYTEVFDNDLISPAQRIEIEARLNELFVKMENTPFEPSLLELATIKAQARKKREVMTTLTILVSMVGAATSMLYTFLNEPSAFVSNNSEWLFSGFAVFIASILVITLMSIIKKERDDGLTPSRDVAYQSAISFELEIAKMIDKAGYRYLAEPKIGDYRPDFVIDADGKKIAIEAKAWSDIIPINAIRRTLLRLEELSSQEGIDGVILVTKKAPPINGLYSDNSKVRICTVSQFAAMLKTKQVA